MDILNLFDYSLLLGQVEAGRSLPSQEMEPPSCSFPALLRSQPLLRSDVMNTVAGAPYELHDNNTAEEVMASPRQLIARS